MTIDEAVQEKIYKLLKTGDYCNTEAVRSITRDIAVEIRQCLEAEICAISCDIDKLRVMNDRLWDTVQKLSEPRFPRIHHFFYFRWLKFWRNWDFNWSRKCNVKK